jgi:hypothetical protein
MAIKKTIKVDGKDVLFKASAAVPRMYRLKFQRDIYKDMEQLQKDFSGKDMNMNGLEIFENVAYIFAKHADPDIPDSPDEWLEQFNMFSVYEIFPQLIDLWGLNVEQEVDSKKNTIPPKGK